MSDLTYYAIGTAAYISVAFPLTFVVFYVFPAVDTNSQVYEDIYTTETLKTTYLDFAKLFYYVICLLLAFTMVNVISLKNIRKNPFLNELGSYSSVYKTLFFGPVYFLISANFSLYGRYDYVGWCDKEKIESRSQDYDSIIQYLLITFVRLFYPEAQLLTDDNPKCKHPSIAEVSLNNFFYFAIPLFIWCNFTHLSDIPFLRHFVLSWEDMKQWGWKQWTFFVFLISFFFLTLIYFNDEYYFRSPYRSMFYITLIIFIILFGIIYTKTHHLLTFHLHHYTLMMILTLLIGLQSIFATICLGTTSAIWMEGVAHYHYTPNWEKNHHYCNLKSLPEEKDDNIYLKDFILV